MSDLASWSVRVADGDGAIYGAGLHLGGGLVLTCAHVVRDATQADEIAVRPTGPVFINFPGLSTDWMAAVVEPDGWWPYDDALHGDAAVLRLSVPPPQGATAAPLTYEFPEGAIVRTFGYPLGRDFGVHARAEIMGETLSQGWYQLDDSRLRGEQIQPGFSGAAVTLEGSGKVAGMVALATVDTGNVSPRVSWMLPIRLLAEHLRPVATALDDSTPVPRQRSCEQPAAALGTSCPLPSDIRDFTGREDEIADASEEIEGADGVPIVQAVYGMGGIGKTTLAVRLAHRCKARYPDGQYFIDLQAHTIGAEPLSPEQALRALLRATLGQPPKDGSSLLELSSMWQDVMRLRRLIVVLDNAESFGQIERLLPRAGLGLMLVTSRRWLEELGADGSVPRQMTVFDENASVELFTRVVGRRRTDAEPDAVKDLVRLCGYLPLAIRLKAAYAKGRPTWSLADIREEMAEEERAEAARGQREGVPMDGRLGQLRLGTAQPVRTAFVTSFRRLSEPHRRLFRLLGLHPPEIMDRRAVEALAENIQTAKAGLEVLTRESLVSEHGRSRIGMHDLLREYARDELFAVESWDARGQAAGRLIDYYLAVALMARQVLLPARPVEDEAELLHPQLPDVSSLAASLQWFEVEHQNLLGCIDLAVQYGHTSYVWRLPRAMGMYLSLSSNSKDAIPCYERGIEAAEASDQRAAADLHGLLGDALRAEGKPDKSLAEFRAARSLYIKLGDSVSAADMLTRGSAPQRTIEGSEQSVASCLQAIEEYTATGDSFGSAEAEYLLAVSARLDGDRARAFGHLRRALDLYQDSAFSAGQARCLNLMGVIQRLGGDYATAIDTLEKAIQLYRKAHDNRGIAHAVNNLASAMALAGNLEQAIAIHGEALERFQKYSPYGYPDALLVAGDLRSKQGDHAAAEQKLREAVRLYRPMRASFGEARAHLLLATALRQQGRYSESASEAGEALSFYRSTGNRAGATAAQLELEACQAALEDTSGEG
ncbi:tetratricopeptide repeat protein [Streptomyces antnestii]|uniref:Tetratricopeptide repeat protein n=1 Tax=Streptomyces antnestii TaxID=2494256 RepID=A0A3S2Z469_9ACTN|nr:tetratricopeptide repeat protein [Streptomyces sp. San01]RVU29001.1 tetratricopeptide repeat protein [Streptomyces sp. San01]